MLGRILSTIRAATQGDAGNPEVEGAIDANCEYADSRGGVAVDTQDGTALRSSG